MFGSIGERNNFPSPINVILTSPYYYRAYARLQLSTNHNDFDLVMTFHHVFKHAQNIDWNYQIFEDVPHVIQYQLILVYIHSLVAH